MALRRRHAHSLDRVPKVVSTRGVSPLLILQARFQQKQLREKEEKLLKLYEEQQKRALKSVGSRSGGSSLSTASSVGAGKVRCLFESRRRTSEARRAVAITGRDKSHPLEPLPDSTSFCKGRSIVWSPDPARRSLSLDGRNFFSEPVGGQARRNQRPPEEVPDFRRDLQPPRNGYWCGSSLTDRRDRTGRFCENRVAGEHDRNRIVGRSEPVFHRDEMEERLKNRGPPRILTERAQPGNRSLGGRTEGANGNANSPVRKIIKPALASHSVAPAAPQKETKTPSRPGTVREVAVTSARRSQSSSSSSSGSHQKPPVRSSPGEFSPPSSAGKSSLPSDLVDCKICGRHFASERVSKHEEVCQKTVRSKRKPFDALQQRVKGTEAEKYVKRSSKMAAKSSQAEKSSKPQSDWRKKHEEFIQNIRAAKEVSVHLKKGGKLSDLPPPPPSDYSDYVQCPHCSRKFNSAAAERHIPKCANIINKPKPAMQRNAALKQGSKLVHAASPPPRGRK